MDSRHEGCHQVHDLIHLAQEVIEMGAIGNSSLHFVIGPVDEEIAQPRHSFGRRQIGEGDKALAFKVEGIRRERVAAFLIDHCRDRIGEVAGRIDMRQSP
jgi:hypothetical protein